MALRSRHCRITAGLASMDMPLLVSSVESQLWGLCSWLYRASWLAQGCIPLLRLLPYFSHSGAEFLRVLCFKFRSKSSRWGSPFRVESVSILDRNEGSSSTFLVFG